MVIFHSYVSLPKIRLTVKGSLVSKKRTGNSAGNCWTIQIDPKLLLLFADLHDRRNQKRTLQMFSQQAIVTQHPKIMEMDDKKPQWSQTPCSTIKKNTEKTMISHVHTCSIYIVFSRTEFSGSDRWGILQFQFTARCSADAVHVPEAERRPQGRKILSEPPGPSRRRCESLALPMALGVRLPEEWIHMMVWSKNNRARYRAPVFFGVWFEERIMKIKNPI